MTSTAIQPLVEELNSLCDPMPYHVGWYFKDLRSGFEADRNGHVQVPSASTRKVSILMTALKQVHEGKLGLDDPMMITAKYQNNTSGVFQHFQPDFTIKFRDALVLMIIVSDNACTGQVAELVGLDNVQALCDSIGMTGTKHRFNIPAAGNDRSPDVNTVNATTPADLGLILDLILKGTTDEASAAKLGCSTELCQYALEVLSWQKHRNRIASMLPEETKVASKTGSLPGNYHDVGIVFKDDEPLYIISMYNAGVPQELPDGTPGLAAANQLMGKMSRACWDALTA